MPGITAEMVAPPIPGHASPAGPSRVELARERAHRALSECSAPGELWIETADELYRTGAQTAADLPA